MKAPLCLALLASTTTLYAQTTTPADTLAPTEELATAEVVQARPIVRYEAGKAIYNLNALQGIEGANALDALNRLPNLRFREDKGFLLNGLTSVVVLVDRRPMRLSTGELEAYLSGLAVSDVASVELLQNPTPEYGTNGMPLLNIITKRHADDGYNAYITARLSHQRYWREWGSARLNVNKGISRSYISYAFTDTRSRETTELLGRTTTHADVRPRQRHQVGLGTWLRLSDRHTLDANLYATYQHERFYHTFGSRLTQPRLLASVQHAYRSPKVEVYSTVEGALAGVKRHTLDATIAYALRDRSAFVRVAPVLYYRLTPHTTLRTGASYDYTTYKNTYHTAGTTFDYDEQRWQALLGVTHQHKRWSVQASASLHTYHTQGNNGTATHTLRNTVLLPSLSIDYTIARHHLLTAEAYAQYRRPDFRDLTPITTPSTDTWLRSGNTALRPAHTHTYALRYTFMRAAQLEVSYADTKHPIVEYPVEPTFGHIHLHKTNLSHSRYLRTLMVLPVPLAQGDRWQWVATTTAAMQRQWDKGHVAGQNHSQTFTTYYLNHNHDLTLGTWTLSASATYYGKLYYELYAMRPTWWTEASLAKRIGQWRITATVVDPFNTNTARGRYDALATPLHFVRQWHAPRLSLTVAYNFGQRQLKTYKNRNLYDATERLSSEANEGVARGVEK